MQHIHIYSAGKNNRDIDPLLAEYEKRLARYYRLQWHLAKTGTKENENTFFRNLLAETRYIVLDASGTDVTTEAISEYLKSTQVRSETHIHLLIGGSYGLSDDLLNGAITRWAFGKITLPHQFVRLLLVEQLYRADCLLRGHPYHH